MAYLLEIASILALSAFFGAAAAPAGGGGEPELPAGWRELPELALAAQPGRVRVESRRAYGDPASGCFALVQRVSGEGAKAAAARAALATGLRARGLEVSGEGEELAFSGLGIEGRIRTAIHDEPAGRFAAVSAACFYNGRQPERCKTQCDGLLDTLGGG
jgi:hypothetical protein